MAKQEKQRKLKQVNVKFNCESQYGIKTKTLHLKEWGFYVKVI